MGHTKEETLGASSEHFAANHRTQAKVQNPALSISLNQLSALAATTKGVRLSTLVAQTSVTPAALSPASTRITSWPAMVHQAPRNERLEPPAAEPLCRSKPRATHPKRQTTPIKMKLQTLKDLYAHELKAWKNREAVDA